MTHLIRGFRQNERAQERQAAYQRGKEEGLRLGYEQSRGELQALFGLLQKVSAKIFAQKEQLLVQFKPEVISFALAACEKIIRNELTDRECYVELLNHYMDQVAREVGALPMKLFLSPEDLRSLGEFCLDTPSVKLFGDPLLRRGDFRIETSKSLLNFDVLRELEEMVK